MRKKNKSLIVISLLYFASCFAFQNCTRLNTQIQSSGSPTDTRGGSGIDPNPIPPVEPPLPTEWKIEPNPSFRVGSGDSMNLSSTLPSHVKKGGLFSVALDVKTSSDTAANIPSGMTLSSSGVLAVGSATSGTTNSIFFRYVDPDTNQELISLKTSIKVLETATPTDGKYTTQPFTGEFAIVYVRIPRTVGGKTRAEATTPAAPINGQFDFFPETAFWVSGMSGPGQLVYRDRSGREQIIFDCITKKHTPIVKGIPDSGGPRDCLPMDPTVSFDGKKVIFSVLYGTLEDANIVPNSPYAEPGARLTRRMTGIAAQIFEADLTTFAVRALDYPRMGDFDTSPIYIPWDESNPHDTDRIMFTSDRAHELPSSRIQGGFSGGSFNNVLLQLYIADKDGANARRTGVHDRDGILHPYVLSDGRITFSAWSSSGLQDFRREGSSQNHAWIGSVDSKGGFFTADFAKHSKRRDDPTHGALNVVGVHFLGETSDRKWVCTTDYYRANNKGSGLLRCFQREPVGVEGPYLDVHPISTFIPRFFEQVISFGANSDTPSALGSTRDPVGIPGNHLMLTWMKGNSCVRPDIGLFQPGTSCDGGIYRTTAVPAGPDQLQMIVNNPDYHEFMPKVAEPYSFIYGIEKPKFFDHQAKSPTGKCYLGSSSMEGEVEPRVPYSFNTKQLSQLDCTDQGCKAREISMRDVKAIRFWEMLPNDDTLIQGKVYKSGKPYFIKSMMGARLKVLGDAPLNADGSFVAEVPCDTTYVMAGVTADGETVLRDQLPQSLRPGEVRTCTGCHLHSGRPGRAFADSLAGAQLKKHFANPVDSGVSFIGESGGFKEMWKGKLVPQVKMTATGESQVSTEGEIYEFNRHVVPVFNKSCVSCHDGTKNPLNLKDSSTKDTFLFKLPAGHELPEFLPPILWNTLTSRKPATGGDWEIPRMSKYIHMAFALESLLYWKTAGARKDGRTDSFMDGDLDYGTYTTDPHKGVPEDHVRIIKNWIDSGAYLHQGSAPIDYRPAK